MKYFVFLFFFGLTVTTYSANTAIEKPLEVINKVEVLKSKTIIKEQDKQDTNENAIAFKCYYTVEWLYKDSPFIEKLEAFA